jgi:predicted DNA-binding transcriptional regulator YafY
MDQPKLERLLRLMKMLTGNTFYSIKDLSERLEMSVRTIYRYIDTFRAAGFVIKKQGDVWRIDKSSPYFKDISQLIHFTKEEAYILKSAIESIDENNLLKQNLKKKLYTVYDYKILAETIVHNERAQNVNRIVESIENKQQVVLRSYRSANSKAMSDRIVEPFKFTTNYIQLWAYELVTSENKLFNLSRVDGVTLLDIPWQYEAQHRSGFVDVFRISSFDLFPVKLKMGLRSASLLTEEYPLAKKQLDKINDNEWLFDTQVCSYDGVGRFVMGLLEDISIIDSPGFLIFIEKKIKAYKK